MCEPHYVNLFFTFEFFLSSYDIIYNANTQELKVIPGLRSFLENWV